MTDRFDTALIFGLLALFQVIGGAALGAGLRARRRLPMAWGALFGSAPLYFGVERVWLLGDWLPLIGQLAVVAASMFGVGLLPRVRAFFLHQGMASLMIGTLIMAAAAVIAAWLVSREAELISQVVGGIGFLFGAMWFGAGIKQLRGK